MTSIYNCDLSELVEKTSEELKKVEAIKPPTWALFVKTGMHKERPPVKNDWWYVRTASVLKHVYRYGPIGVSKLRTKYGGKKNRGVKPGRFYKGSGSILRKILQQLEKEGFLKQDQKNTHKGRVITAKGKKFLDDIAAKISNIIISKTEGTKKEAMPEEKKEVFKKNPKQEKEVPKKETKQNGKEKTGVKARDMKTDKKQTQKKKGSDKNE